MGLFDTIIGFGKNKRGKVITFALIGFGTIFFFVGILMAALGAAVVNPSEIKLIASNMKYENNFFAGGNNLSGYHLTVTEKQTSITVKTPSNTTASATFKVTAGPQYVSITEKVPSNGTAILELKKVNGAYSFHDPNVPFRDLDKIVIDVNCGIRTAKIFVRVLLTPEHVELVATLDKQDEYGGWGNHVQYLDMGDYQSNPKYEPEKGYRNYRINTTLKIFGEPVATLEDGLGFIGPGLYNASFKATEVSAGLDDTDATFSGIKLLGNNEEPHNTSPKRCDCTKIEPCFCCDFICTCIDADFISVPAEYISYFFKISCTFIIGEGSNLQSIYFTCFTNSDFELKIRTWNGKK